MATRYDAILAVNERGRARKDDNAAARRLRKAIELKANTEAKLAQFRMRPIVPLNEFRDLRDGVE